jgi:Tol biopolymer transport system component
MTSPALPHPATADPRTLAPGQSSLVRVAEVRTGRIVTVHESRTILFEAPNWTRSGELVLNARGVLWRMPADGSAPPAEVRITGVPALNNDHVLDPDGVHVYLSADDGQLYRAPLAGGEAARVTTGDGSIRRYLHGVSPDGGRLAYIGLSARDAQVHTVATDGSDDIRLTGDPGPADGSEYSPDGGWLYFSTERFSTVPGHAQIARMRTDGSGMEQLTVDDDVNWFPHLAPDGRTAVYLAFPPGTRGHPADREVALRLVRDGRWRSPETLHRLPGGQGTINVNSWSPDSERFAFVEYPVAPAR